jgi:hypothetical protein
MPSVIPLSGDFLASLNGAILEGLCLIDNPFRDWYYSPAQGAASFANLAIY